LFREVHFRQLFTGEGANEAALILPDGKKWDAQDFAANPKDWRTRHRCHLT
jgi:hypothetical protein